MKRWIFLALAAALLIVVPQLLIESATYARIVSIVGVCLLLWISEAVPPFVPTLLLWTLVPLFLGPLDGKFALPNVLSWAVDPVMALFFGGFVLGVATESSGLDKRLTQFALRSAGKSFRRFLLFVILITALLSMWMSNIAAAALVLACLHPILGKFENDHILRRCPSYWRRPGSRFWRYCYADRDRSERNRNCLDFRDSAGIVSKLDGFCFSADGRNATREFFVSLVERSAKRK